MSSVQGGTSSFETPAGIDFGRLLDYPARFFPRKVAIVDDAASITFEGADQAAQALAAAFIVAGAQKGDRIAIILPNCIQFILAEMAIIRAAMVKVPLNIRFAQREVLFALEDCAPTVLVCEAGFATEAAAALASVPSLKAVFTIGGAPGQCLSFEEAVASGRGFDAVRVEPNDPILIRYTGGTTGRAKGIVHTAESFLAINLDAIREYSFRHDEVALHLGHLSHGLNFMWAALYGVGATQILHEKFEANRILEEIARRRVTYIYMVPTMIHRLMREDDGTADVSSLRTFLYSSAPMPVPLLRQAIQRYGNIFVQAYTLSEAPVVTTIFRPEEHVEIETSAGPRLASCGREVITMEIRLLDNSGREAAPGEAGEIAVRSVNNMAAYWNRPEETRATLVDGWLLTGDMARRDEDGYLYLVDRKKDIIITGALNVYPKEVEDVLHEHEAVSQAAVIGVPDDEWGEIIRAYVVLKPASQASAEELIEHCRGSLAGYKKPREVLFVESLPLSPIGKVSRVALRQQARSAARGSA